MEQELEVKLLGVNFIELEKAILAQHGQLLVEEQQENILFDTQDSSLHKSGSYLRIRKTKNLMTGDESAEFTFKQKQANQTVRENLEINTEIGNTDNLMLILEKLGYIIVTRGQKHRKSYSIGEARIDFDTWDQNTYPYPYVEIEVKDSHGLDEILKSLSIDKGKVSLKSIRELQLELKEK